MPCITCGDDNFDVDVCTFIVVPPDATLTDDFEVAVAERDLQCIEKIEEFEGDVSLEEECGEGTILENYTVPLDTIRVLGAITVQVAAGFSDEQGNNSYLCSRDMVSIREEEAPFCICSDECGCDDLNIDTDVTIVPNDDFVATDVTDDMDETCDGERVYKVTGSVNFTIICPPCIE
ncbi:MAG: hypothetical protein ACOCP5_03755 [Halanaerobiaceae bacterium]